MVNPKDILFINESLLFQLIAFLEQEGIITKLVRSKAEGTKQRGAILFKWLGIGLKTSKEISTSNGLNKEFTPTVLNVANAIISENLLLDLIPNYHEALKRERKGKFTRFVKSDCYITFIIADQGEVFNGDIVIYDSIKPNKTLNQHIILFNNKNNKAAKMIGTHCRPVSTITFWPNNFSSKRRDNLTRCDALIVWEKL